MPLSLNCGRGATTGAGTLVAMAAGAVATAGTGVDTVGAVAGVDRGTLGVGAGGPNGFSETTISGTAGSCGALLISGIATAGAASDCRAGSTWGCFSVSGEGLETGAGVRA